LQLCAQLTVNVYHAFEGMNLEIDGGQHADRSAEDEVRSSFFKSYGYRVVRYWDNQVLENTDEVLAEIEKLMGAVSSES
jgi:very-short-patch-repair endonuclease